MPLPLNSSTPAVPDPLIKFPLHPSSTIGQSSYVGSFIATHPPPIPLNDLNTLRNLLDTAFKAAQDRIKFKELNKENIAQRQALQKRAVEAQAEQVNAERKRRAKEEEDRRDKDRKERERLLEEEKREQVKQEEVEAQEGEEEEDDDDMDDEDEVPLAQATAKTNLPAKQGAGQNNDVKPTLQAGSGVRSSPEPDDDGQPRPPPRHKPHEHRKRKRDQVVDSDDASDSAEGDEPLVQKVRKAEEKARPTSVRPTPGPSRSASLAPLASVALPPPSDHPDPLDGLTPIQRKLHQQRFAKHAVPYKAAAPGAAVNFQLPTTTLVPYKPPSIPPPSTAKRQSEVAEDFSKAKPGTQIAHGTFHTWAEFYLRPFGEDDLAFLAPRPYDQTPYEIPALGKHYIERWDEEDADPPTLTPAATATSNAPGTFNALEPPPQQRFRPDSVSEDLLATEGIYLGPLSERLVAAMVFEEPGEGGELEEQAEEDEEGGRVGKVLDAVELEERIKGEMRFVGLLGEGEVSWREREDDEVSSALRACQRALARQTALNESRKAILTSIVKDRMGYQEYEKTRDDQERVIETGWNRRQKGGKKKGKQSKVDKDRAEGAGAGGGGGVKAPVSLALQAAVQKRGKLVDKFRPFFEEEEEGWRWMGMPERSVFGEEEAEGVE